MSRLPSWFLSTSNVPSALIVQMVPSELFHVPANAAGPERGAVAQALTKTSEIPARIVLKEGWIFMPFILSCVTEGDQAQSHIVARGSPHLIAGSHRRDWLQRASRLK